MIKTTLISCSLAFMLTGCFTQEPPKCSDEDVKATLQSIYTGLIEKAGGNLLAAAFMQNLPKEFKEISSARSVAYDEEVKMRSCKAEATFENGQSASIAYTVQLSEEDSDEFYVELETDFLEALMQQSIMQGILSKEKN